MTVFNQTRGQTVASRAGRADTFWTRLQGLMGRRSLDVGEALIIEPCQGVHMLFMRFAIDVFHVAADGRVLRIVPNLKPWRLGPVVRGSRFVIELPAGAALATGTREGDILICK
ncbi:MAG: DUF192 domain-containing protein [Symbiobacteriia bacterium]